MAPETRLRELVERFAREVQHQPAPPPAPPFPGKRASLGSLRANLRRPLIVSALSLLLIGFGSALAFAVNVAAIEHKEAQIRDLRQYAATLEQRLADYETGAFPVRELPPPYPEVRSGFTGWHICTTGDCGTTVKQSL